MSCTYTLVIIIEFTLLLIGIFSNVDISQVCVYFVLQCTCETLWEREYYKNVVFLGNLFPTNERAVRTIRNLYVENERVIISLSHLF